MKKALLILNPTSGKMQLKNKLLDIVTCLSEEYDVTVCPTKCRDHARQIALAAYDKGYDAVICAGGDGTLNETVCGIMESGHDLPIGYIPAGSTNDFASGLGLKRQPIKAAEAILAGQLHGQDIGLFNGSRRFTYIASFGAFTETSYGTNQSLKNTFGHLAYLLDGAKYISKIKAVHMKIKYDDKETEGDYIFGGVANATTIGGVLRLKDSRLNFNDGIFEILLIRKPKNLLELNTIVTSLMRFEYNGDLVQMLRGSRVEFSFDGKLDWSLDGEHASSDSHVTVQNLHSGIHLIY